MMKELNTFYVPFNNLPLSCGSFLFDKFVRKLTKMHDTNTGPFSILHRSAVLSLHPLAELYQLGPVRYSDWTVENLRICCTHIVR